MIIIKKCKKNIRKNYGATMNNNNKKNDVKKNIRKNYGVVEKIYDVQINI